MATYNKFNQFVQNQNQGTYNFASDALYLMLTNTAPTATNAIKTDITEIAAGNGYPAGGFAVTTVSEAQTGGTYKLTCSLPSPTLTATGAVGPFRYAVLYDSTPTTPLKPLISWWDLGTNISLVSGNTITLTFDATNGVFQET